MTPLLLSIVLSCSMPIETPKNLEIPPSGANLLRRHEHPVVVAHRGDSHGAPENTLAAYRLAIQQGATAAETDVQLTADGTIVLMHDDTIDRTTTGTGAVSALHYGEISNEDAGSWFDSSYADERIPTLDALLDLSKDRLALCIEIKDGSEIAEKIAVALDQRMMRDQVVIFSFDPQQVVAAKKAMSDVPVLWLATRDRLRRRHPADAVGQAVALGADAIGFDHHFANKEMVAEAHAERFPPV